MRLSPLFTLSLLLTTWQTAFAVTTDDCSKITTDAERLACFDSVSKQNETSANAEAEGDGQKSKWKLNTTQSKMDDSTSYSLTALSDNKIDGGMDDSGYGAVMIGCSNGCLRPLLSPLAMFWTPTRGPAPRIIGLIKNEHT